MTLSKSAIRATMLRRLDLCQWPNLWSLALQPWTNRKNLKSSLRICHRVVPIQWKSKRCAGVCQTRAQTTQLSMGEWRSCTRNLFFVACYSLSAALSPLTATTSGKLTNAVALDSPICLSRHSHLNLQKRSKAKRGRKRKRKVILMMYRGISSRLASTPMWTHLQGMNTTQNVNLSS